MYGRIQNAFQYSVYQHVPSLSWRRRVGDAARTFLCQPPTAGTFITWTSLLTLLCSCHRARSLVGVDGMEISPSSRVQTLPSCVMLQNTHREVLVLDNLFSLGLTQDVGRSVPSLVLVMRRSFGGFRRLGLVLCASRTLCPWSPGASFEESTN